MNDVFPVPGPLKKHVTSVSDNRQAGDELLINPTLFVSIFREDLDAWLETQRAKRCDSISKK